MEEQGSKLFSLMKELHKEKLWNDYWDTDMLAIQLPDREEPVFVSILGKTEENYGFLIYRNLKELAYLFETLALSDEWDAFKLLLRQSCLAINFENREDLEKEEYDMVKKSGIPFRGKKAWPVLTDYRPGYYPAIPSQTELNWLTEVLEKVLETAKHFRSKLHFYESEDYDFQFLMRDYKADGTIKEGLFDVPEEILQGVSPDIIGRAPVLVSPFEMLRVKQTPLTNSSWELDLDQVDIPVDSEEGEDRSFFPSIFMIVDPAQQTILDTDVVKEEEVEHLQRRIIQLFLSTDTRPAEIVIDADKEPQLTAYFWDLFHELGIRLTVVDQLPVISSIKEQISDLTPDQS